MRTVCLVAVFLIASFLSAVPANACGVRAFGWSARTSKPKHVDSSPSLAAHATYYFMRAQQNPANVAVDILTNMARYIIPNITRVDG